MIHYMSISIMHASAGNFSLAVIVPFISCDGLSCHLLLLKASQPIFHYLVTHVAPFA